MLCRPSTPLLFSRINLDPLIASLTFTTNETSLIAEDSFIIGFGPNKVPVFSAQQFTHKNPSRHNYG